MSEALDVGPKDEAISQPTQEKRVHQPPPQATQSESSAIELEIANIEKLIKIMRHQIGIKRSIISIIISLSIALIAITILVAIYQNNNVAIALLIIDFILILVVPPSIFSSIRDYIKGRSNIISWQTDIDLLNVRKRLLSPTLKLSQDNSAQASNSYFDKLVEINVVNLEKYYLLVRSHTEKSFMVSIAAGVIGFVLIAIGLVFGFANATNSQLASYIATGSGIIREFIAGVFFYLYNRTVRQMKGYHDSLITVQNILLSFKIVGDTKDENEKAKMVERMLAYLVGKQGILTTPEDN